MFRMLLIHTAPAFVTYLARKLAKMDCEIDSAEDSLQAILQITRASYDLVIIGPALPDMSEEVLVEMIHKIVPTQTIYPLSDRLARLAAQGERSLAEQQELDLFFAKIIRLIKKQATAELPALLDAPILEDEREALKLDRQHHLVYKAGQVQKLTRREYEILELLLQRKDSTVTREELKKRIWTENVEEINLKTIDGYIKKLRDKLDIHSIKTIRGRGYKWQS